MEYQKGSFILILSLLCFPALLSAQELSIGTVHVVPRGYIDEQGRLRGCSYEIVTAIVEEAGYDSKHSLLLPFRRILWEMEKGQIDVALLVPNEDVTEVGDPLIPLQTVHFIIVGRHDSPLEKPEDFQGFRVGYLNSTTISVQLLQDQSVELVPVINYKSLVNMLLTDRLDAVVGPRINIYNALRELDYPADELGQELLLRQTELSLVLSKTTGNRDIRNALLEASRELLADGTIEGIIEKYDYYYRKTP
ncbi:MAG: transporter substrate-binding domain-containing protein [Spirochaetales bacterium]|nr:transporter substrate-binding domain-containing protein [Spirochaetales bacterium]